MHTCPASCSALTAVNGFHGPAQDEYVWQEEKKKVPNCIFFPPFNAQGRFMRSSPSKISLYTSSKALSSVDPHKVWRMKGRVKWSIGRLGSGRGTLKLTSSGQKNPFSVIIGIRYVQGTRLRGNLLTLSAGNKRWGLKKLVEVTLNALTFMVLSPLLLCHLQSAHSVLFFLNAVQHFAHSPLTVWSPAEGNNGQTKSLVHVLHQKVAHFPRVEQTLP